MNEDLFELRLLERRKQLAKELIAESKNDIKNRGQDIAKLDVSINKLKRRIALSKRKK